MRGEGKKGQEVWIGYIRKDRKKKKIKEIIHVTPSISNDSFD